MEWESHILNEKEIIFLLPELFHFPPETMDETTSSRKLIEKIDQGGHLMCKLIEIKQAICP